MDGMNAKLETTKALKAVIRQMLLALVILVAIREGLNGPLIYAYFGAALLLAGVDVSEVIESGFEFSKLSR